MNQWIYNEQTQGEHKDQFLNPWLSQADIRAFFTEGDFYWQCLSVSQTKALLTQLVRTDPEGIPFLGSFSIVLRIAQLIPFFLEAFKKNVCEITKSQHEQKGSSGGKQGSTNPAWHSNDSHTQLSLWQRVAADFHEARVLLSAHTELLRGRGDPLRALFSWHFIFTKGVHKHLWAASSLSLQRVGDAWGCFLGWILRRSKKKKQTPATAR